MSRTSVCGEVKRAIGLTMVLLTLGVSVMLYCEWRGNFADTIYVCRKLFWVLPVFAIFMCVAHYFAGKGLSNRQYMKGIIPIGRDSLAHRKVYLDYARVLAAVMVILTHACSMQMGEAVAAWRTNLLTICASLGLVCNPLYVMISGALLLSSEKEESIGEFYYRRFVKVVVPMVVYYAIFLCVSGQMSFIPLRGIDTGFLQILAGASGIVPHYWLIYTLISLYIVAPFVRVMVQNLSDSQINALFVIVLLEEIVITFLPLTGVQNGFVLNLASWEGVFILGYIILERRTKIMEWLVLALGGVSAFAIPIVLLKDYSLTDYVCNTAPTMVLLAGAILILLSKCECVLRNKAAGAVGLLSQYSYSVILVHWHGLFVVTWGKIGLQPLRFGCVGGILSTVVVATIVCFVMGFVADNTIVFVIQQIFTQVGKWFKRIRRFDVKQ